MTSPSPLPDRLRPTDLDEVLGQPQLLGAQGVLSQLIGAGHLPSLILWGPPGSGKTTLARLLAKRLELHGLNFSAVLGGVAELRKLIEEAEKVANLGTRSLLFIDEIHRFNKAQQDALLPHVEAGTVVLVGATTENPSFSVNRALLSRCRVFALQPLDGAALEQLIERARTHPLGLPDLAIAQDAREALLRLCAGDARRLLMMLESAYMLCRPAPISAAAIAQVSAGARSDHDAAGENHYDVASAFIKSMRASDVDAALYYLARQLEAGEDPRFVARRLVIFASEDVGQADPQVLLVATAAMTVVEHIGMPEAVYPLSQATISCATAPKSNSTKAYFAAAQALAQHPGAQVPLFLRNAPTGLMQEMGYRQGYVYDHDAPDHFAGQQCLPDEMLGEIFYRPGPFGFEREISKRLEWWTARRKARN